MGFRLYDISILNNKRINLFSIAKLKEDISPIKEYKLTGYYKRNSDN